MTVKPFDTPEEDDFGEAFDFALRSALLDAQRLKWAPLLDGPVPKPNFSRRYLRFEKELLKNPFGYARACARPVWQKILRAAVWILVAAGVTVGGLWLNPSTRAWVEQVFFQRFADHDEYRFNGDSTTFNAQEPTYIPDGFSLVSTSQESAWLTLTYQNEEAACIYFDAVSLSASSGTVIDNEHSKIYEVTIGTDVGTMYEALEPGKVNFLLWFDDTAEIAYSLSAPISPEELIQMAESLENIKA